MTCFADLGSERPTPAPVVVCDWSFVKLADPARKEHLGFRVLGKLVAHHSINPSFMGSDWFTTEIKGIHCQRVVTSSRSILYRLDGPADAARHDSQSRIAHLMHPFCQLEWPSNADSLLQKLSEFFSADQQVVIADSSSDEGDPKSRKRRRPKPSAKPVVLGSAQPVVSGSAQPVVLESAQPVVVRSAQQRSEQRYGLRTRPVPSQSTAKTFVITDSSSDEGDPRIRPRRRKAASAQPVVPDSTKSSSDTEPSSTNLGSSAPPQVLKGDVVCSGTRDLAEKAMHSLLKTVHCHGKFRVENSKTLPYPYFYMGCKSCRHAKCGVEQRKGATWTIKSVTPALSTACVMGQIGSSASAVATGVRPMEQHTAAASPTKLVASASALAVAAVNAIDIRQLMLEVSAATVACTSCTVLTEEGALARCGNGTHSFCSSCFSDCVGDAVRGGSKPVCIAAGGSVLCRWCPVGSYCQFDVQKYAALLSKDIFRQWLDVMAEIKIQQETSKLIELLKQQKEDNFQILVKAGAVSDDMMVERHYNHIAEKLILATCPKCGQLICDFEACCALQCGRRDGMTWAPGFGCGAYICAWCLETKPTEKELHDHVMECPFNARPYSMYPPPGHPADWQKVMHELARKRIKQFITDSVEPNLQERVYNKVASSNPEIGLGLQPWGTITSDGFRPSKDQRRPTRPSMEDNVTTLITMQMVDNRQQALQILEAANNNVDLAITFAMAARQR